MRIVAALLLISLTWAGGAQAQAAAAKSEVAVCPQWGGPVVEAIEKTRAPPARALNCTQKQFISQYAATLKTPLDGLDNFIDAVNDPKFAVCNLLCSSRIVPKFWVNQPASAVDLIRYVFTSTCHGVASSHREAAFKQLDGVMNGLYQTDVKAFAKLIFEGLAPHDRHFLRGEFGDILQSTDPKFPTDGYSSPSKELWRQAAAGGRASPHREPPALSRVLLQATDEACATSFVKVRNEQANKPE
jgi:hypothetical protein